MAHIRATMTATLSLTAGTGTSRVVDLPAGETQAPNFVFTVARPVDPTNNTLFKLVGLAGHTPTTRDQFVGGHQFELVYDLAGSDPVDVEFVFVWLDESVPNTAYQGD